MRGAPPGLRGRGGQARSVLCLCAGSPACGPAVPQAAQRRPSELPCPCLWGLLVQERFHSSPWAVAWDSQEQRALKGQPSLRLRSQWRWPQCAALLPNRPLAPCLAAQAANLSVTSARPPVQVPSFAAPTQVWPRPGCSVLAGALRTAVPGAWVPIPALYAALSVRVLTCAVGLLSPF